MPEAQLFALDKKLQILILCQNFTAQQCSYFNAGPFTRKIHVMLAPMLRHEFTQKYKFCIIPDHKFE